MAIRLRYIAYTYIYCLAFKVSFSACMVTAVTFIHYKNVKSPWPGAPSGESTTAGAIINYLHWCYRSSQMGSSYSCSRPQPDMDNCVRYGRSNWYSVTRRPSHDSSATERYLHGANARLRSKCLGRESKAVPATHDASTQTIWPLWVLATGQINKFHLYMSDYYVISIAP